MSTDIRTATLSRTTSAILKLAGAVPTPSPAVFMGKKYLLYIHNPLFADEKAKSLLVNLLLNSYYQKQPKKRLTSSSK